MAHTVIPPPRGPTATLELAHKGNINDKTILERDREVRDFNVTLLASAITRRRHLVIDTHRTDLGVTLQGCLPPLEKNEIFSFSVLLLGGRDSLKKRKIRGAEPQERKRGRGRVVGQRDGYICHLSCTRNLQSIHFPGNVGKR